MRSHIVALRRTGDSFWLMIVKHTSADTTHLVFDIPRASTRYGNIGGEPIAGFRAFPGLRGDGRFSIPFASLVGED